MYDIDFTTTQKAKNDDGTTTIQGALRQTPRLFALKQSFGHLRTNIFEIRRNDPQTIPLLMLGTSEEYLKIQAVAMGTIDSFLLAQNQLAGAVTPCCKRTMSFYSRWKPYQVPTIHPSAELANLLNVLGTSINGEPPPRQIMADAISKHQMIVDVISDGLTAHGLLLPAKQLQALAGVQPIVVGISI